ncbi:MAG: transcription antitermination factor NusB [Clostridia bacterium]
MKRTQIRELAFQLLYSLEIQKEIEEEQIQLFLEENEIEEEEQSKYIRETLAGVQNKKEAIELLIANNLKENWTMQRIAKIDLAILKLAIYEMVFVKLPYKVVINEAVELAKKYGDDNAKSFVNGILASVVKEEKLA